MKEFICIWVGNGPAYHFVLPPEVNLFPFSFCDKPILRSNQYLHECSDFIKLNHKNPVNDVIMPRIVERI